MSVDKREKFFLKSTKSLMNKKDAMGRQKKKKKRRVDPERR